LAECFGPCFMRSLDCCGTCQRRCDARWPSCFGFTAPPSIVRRGSRTSGSCLGNLSLRIRQDANKEENAGICAALHSAICLFDPVCCCWMAPAAGLHHRLAATRL